MQQLFKINKRASDDRKAGKVLENDHLVKAVLRSQPPHPDDVADMVDWNAKWGGGDNGYFVKDFGDFVQAMGISTSNRISGRTCRTLADLNFGAEMSSHAVMAVLKRVAWSEKVIDVIASSVFPNQITAFGVKHKEAFVEAGKIVKRNENILKENNIEDRQRIIAAGWLQTTLIDHILERPNRDGKLFKAMDDIVKEFLLRVFNGAPAAPIVEAPGSSSSGIVQYNDVGSAIDVAKMILVTQGFEVNKNYHWPKAKQRIWAWAVLCESLEAHQHRWRWHVRATSIFEHR